MKEREAIKDIKENIKPVVGGKSLDMAIKSLEKQIPKKVINRRRNGEYADCPICKIELEMPWTYCYKCGNKVDWTVEE